MKDADPILRADQPIATTDLHGVGPLAGLRVLDITHTVAGMYCTRLLADYGATVVRIPLRQVRELADDEDDHAQAYSTALDLALNEGKLNRAGARSLATLIGLIGDEVAESRLVVEDCSPGELASMGLGYADLQARRPDVVYVSITPFGQTGPSAAASALAPDIVVNAAGGLMGITGNPGGTPLRLGGESAGTLAGAYAAVAAVAAAFVEGVSIHIDISAQHALATACLAQVGNYAYSGIIDKRPIPQGPNDVYRTKDGYIYAKLRPQHSTTADDLAAFLTALPGEPVESEQIAADATIRTIAAVKFASLPAREIVSLAQSFRIADSIVQDVAQLRACPQLAAYQFFVQRQVDGIGEVAFGGRPFDLEPYAGRPGAAQIHAPVMDAAGKRSVHGGRHAPAPFLPLTGLRVLAPEQIFAGPIATYLLAMLGAEVVKVEGPDRPDGFPGIRGQQGAFNEVNRSKRSLSLNLKHPLGRDLLLGLVKHFDVVVENYTRRVMPSLGLSYQELADENPRLIMVSSTGYGHRPPFGDYKAYGPNIELASGLGLLNTDENGVPVRPGGLAYGDLMAGVYGAFAVLVGLFQRRQSGVGSFIELSQYRMLASTLRHEIVASQLVDAEALASTRRSNRDMRNAPQGCYECAGDDTWVVIAIRTDEEWRRLVQLIADPRLVALRDASIRERRAEELVIDSVIRSWVRGRARELAATSLIAAGVPAAQVLEPYELLEDSQLRARNAFEWIDFSAQGWSQVRPHFRAPWTFIGAGMRQGSPAPAALGRDTSYYLHEFLGCDDARLAELEREHVTGGQTSSQVREYVRGLPEELVRNGQAKGYEPDFLAKLGLFASRSD